MIKTSKDFNIIWCLDIVLYIYIEYFILLTIYVQKKFWLYFTAPVCFISSFTIIIINYNNSQTIIWHYRKLTVFKCSELIKLGALIFLLQIQESSDNLICISQRIGSIREIFRVLYIGNAKCYYWSENLLTSSRDWFCMLSKRNDWLCFHRLWCNKPKVEVPQHFSTRFIAEWTEGLVGW